MKKIDIDVSKSMVTEEKEYECDICKDQEYVKIDSKEGVKGRILVDEKFKGFDKDGVPIIEFEYLVQCKCSRERNFRKQLESISLGNNFDKYRFKNFEPYDDHLKNSLTKSKNFAFKPDTNMFFLTGRAGSGKSHLGTAIAINMMYSGYDVSYRLWESEMINARNNYRAMDELTYSSITNVEVLYIDDFLKQTGNNLQELKRDYMQLDLARAIINHRYSNPKLITIISTEWTIEELDQLDESMADRIREMTQGKNIVNLGNRNYRKRKWG